jgi:curved DNA-binding protein CbpA
VYLASKKINGQIQYVIRETYQQENCFLSRDLIELGPDPARHIIYPGGNAFYIHESIEDRLIDLGAGRHLAELEDIFWRFVDPEIRRVLEPFRCREDRHRASRKKNAVEDKNFAPLHIFDKRRAHYLKFGQTDQRNLGQVPPKLFRNLYHKSRDEIEHGFMDMEDALSPREYKSYTYTIFDLQHYFYESFAHSYPQMLSQTKIDKHFIEQICRLNRDPLFWAGMAVTDRLHEYLVRYVLMHFDHDYAPGSFIEDYLRQFINSRREYRPPFKRAAAGLKQASRLLGISRSELKKMSRREVVRLYRRKAQQWHPDKGGDPEKFVKLTEAYHELIKTKKK